MIWGETGGFPGTEAMPGSAAPRQLPPRHPQATGPPPKPHLGFKGRQDLGQGWHRPRPGSQQGQPEGFKPFLHDLCCAELGHGGKNNSRRRPRWLLRTLRGSGSSSVLPGGRQREFSSWS